MAYTRLTSAETNLLETIARQPASAPLAAPWLPRRKIEDAYKLMDYTMQRVEPPVLSPLGEFSTGVSSSKSETNRPIGSFRMTWALNKTDLRIAQRNGYNIVAQNIAMMRSSMEHNILKLVFQGNTGERDLPDISGMMDVGEDIDNSEETVYWATATAPVTHASYGYDDLIANNYFGPFSWILSYSLKSGLQALNNAANPRTHEEIIRAGYVQGGIYFYQHGTSAYGAGGYTTYPLPAATHDGLHIMFAPKNGVGEDNFYLAEVTNGIELRVADTTDENNNYVYEMEWRGTPVFRGATTASAASAPYIVYAPDVDFAS
jgi:hypothetical protein